MADIFVFRLEKGYFIGKCDDVISTFHYYKLHGLNKPLGIEVIIENASVGDLINTVRKYTELYGYKYILNPFLPIEEEDESVKERRFCQRFCTVIDPDSD